MRKKLLLADDSITIQKVVELTFPSDEFEVVTAGNGRIAIDKAMTFLPDVVLCDVIMPQLDGYQVCEALRASEQLKNVPILLLNGAFEPYDAERAKAVGALGNVSKPFDPPALVARVKELLAERNTGAISRPASALSSDEFAALSEAHDQANTGEVLPASDVVQHAYYDESETHPVSTIEVPMGVRELAARSLSLDAPVFAQAEPEVLTSETEPADFAETLHGPLDAEVPGAVQDTVEAHVETVEEVEAIDDLDPVVTTAEVESPVRTEATTHEPIEFDTESPLGEELPSTLPPTESDEVTDSSTVPMVEEFSGEHEFDPHELDAPVPAPEPVAEAAPEALPSLPEPEPEPEPLPAPTPAEPEAMAVPEPVAALDADVPTPAPASAPTAVEELAAPITPASLETAIGMPAIDPNRMDTLAMTPAPVPEPVEEAPAPLAAATAAAVAASSTGFSGLVDLQPEPELEPEPVAPSLAPTPVAANGTPSAEVAVPVDMVQQIAQRVISQVSERVIREIAWDVIPGLAEKLIKAEIERIKARAESERD